MAVTVRYTDNFSKFESVLISQLTTGANDISLDLVNAARSTAPHKYGQLERGINGEVKVSNSSIKVIVGTSAKGSNGYDYAEKMHNGYYKLGEQSLAKGSGYSGISGKTFPVGNRYIELPATESYQSYVNYFGNQFNKAARSF